MDSTPNFVVNILKDNWQPGKKILEIGCGPAFLKNYFKDDYTGCDIVDSQYNKNLPRNVDVVCPANNLLFEKESFDIIVVKSSFHLFEDYQKCLSEALRVLRPKGKLIIFDYNKKTQKELQKNEKNKVYPCWSQRQLKKIVKDSGFKNVKNLVASEKKTGFLKRVYGLILQDIVKNWIIVYGEK